MTASDATCLEMSGDDLPEMAAALAGHVDGPRERSVRQVMV